MWYFLNKEIKMKQFVILTVVGILSIGFSFSQDNDEVNHGGKHHGIENHAHWVKVKKADNLLIQHSYYNAVDLYKEVEIDIPDNEYLQHQMANAYFVSRDYANAEKYFLRATSHKNHDDEYPMDRFKYAETLKMNGKYDDATVQFEYFIKQNRRDRSADMKYWTRIASNEVKSCNYAKSVVNEDSTFHTVEFIDGDVNHAYTDFSPYPQGKNELYFASLRQDSVLGYNKNEDVYYPVKLYSSTKEDSIWSEPKELPFNHEFEHTANIVLSPDGKRAYFTRCFQDRHNKVICNIFYSDKDSLNNQWGTAHKAGGGVNSGSYTSTQPAVEHYKKRRRRRYLEYDILYFVSDRPNGQGGTDIWFTEVNGNKFSTPENCGRRINTMRDEITPTYDQKEKKLYFSSNYHWGIGGYDAFVSSGSQKRFSKPENLGVPTNSSYDDTYYVPVVDKKDSLDYGYLVSNRPGGIALTSETCCDDIYEYQEYIPEYISLEGIVKEEYVATHDTVMKQDSGVVTVKNLSKVDSASVVVNDSILPLRKAVAARVGYVRKKSITQVEEEGLNPSIENLQEHIVWLDSTDRSGEFSSKLLKGKKYALVVEKEGYNSKMIDLDSVLTQQGDLSNVEITLPKKVQKMDSSATSKPKSIAFEEREKLSLDTETEHLEKDSKLLLDNMYFDTNQDKIKASSKPSLELLLAFMKKHDGIKIEISGHTDSRGNDDYNLDLSQRRAESVMDYLISNGVDEKQLVAKGYGETEPIAPNQNKDGSDNPEGRKLNRRTEIKILSNKK